MRPVASVEEPSQPERSQALRLGFREEVKLMKAIHSTKALPLLSIVKSG
jgi:hypothetical protein